MSVPSARMLNAIGFLATVLAMAFALYLQYFMKLTPCNLCMLQRATMISLGFVYFIAFLHNPRRLGGRLYAIISFFLSLIGIGLAARHVWLQSLPPEAVPACGPDFNYMMEEFPISETIVTILQGSGDCAEISWQWLGLTIPEQLLLLFIGFTLLSIFQIFRSNPGK